MSRDGGESVSTHPRLLHVALLFMVFASLGCATNKAIQIKSVPSGATVFVDGKQVGVTPLVLTTNDLMPRRAFDGKPSTQAMLVIEKPGYSTYQLLLREFALPDHVDAELRPESDSGSVAVEPTGGVLEEIERLQQLREKGAITDAEFEKLKEAVMERAAAKPPSRP
jgi:hypothetical protein